MTLVMHRRPETDLMCCCARSFVGPEKAERIRALLQKEIDWAYVMRTGTRHSVTPLLYRSLKTVCPEAVPEAVMNRLRSHYSGNLLRNLTLTEELFKILDLLEENGISAVPFKGPILASCFYGDLALRRFDDLDILVHRENVLKAIDLIRSLGYFPSSPLTAEQTEQYLDLNFQYALQSAEKEVFLEIHWSLTPEGYSFSTDLKQLWKRSETVLFEGRKIRSFASEDLLRFLCFHGSKHRWGRLQWICDVAELIGHERSWDWPRMIGETETSGAKRMVALGLFLVDDLLETPLPEKVSKWVRSDPSVEKLAFEVYENLFSEAPDLAGFVESKFNSFFKRTMIYPQDRLKLHVKQILVPCAIELKLLKLPSFLFPLYYFFRPIRLIIKYSGGLSKRFLQRKNMSEHRTNP